MSSRPLVVGIEGGATRTSALVLDVSNGKEMCLVQGPCSNPFLIGMDGCATIMVQLIEECKRECEMDESTRFHAVGMCLSGIDREDEKQTLLSEMEKRNASLADVFVVENDATAPMELISSSLDIPGYVVISGTGSIAMGLIDGVYARSGGWGYLLGDEGSAYSISSRALRLILRGTDHNGVFPDKINRLHELMLEHFQISSREGLLTLAYKEFSKDRIAGFAVRVAQAAFEGDSLAQSIMDKHGRQIANLLWSLFDRAGMCENGFPHRVRVACVGGTWHSLSLFQASLEERFRELRSCSADKENELVIELWRPLESCAVGGALLAARRVALPVVFHDLDAYMSQIGEIHV